MRETKIRKPLSPLQSQIQILTDRLSRGRKRERERGTSFRRARHTSPVVQIRRPEKSDDKEGDGSAVPILLRALVRLELGLELGLAGVERVEHGGADERADCPGGGLRQALPVHPAAAVPRHRPSPPLLADEILGNLPRSVLLPAAAYRPFESNKQVASEVRLRLCVPATRGEGVGRPMPRRELMEKGETSRQMGGRRVGWGRQPPAATPGGRVGALAVRTDW